MKTKEVLTNDGAHYGWKIYCPACEDFHLLRGCTFNGDQDNPTFNPSLLVSMNFADPDPETGARSMVCHSFIEDGKIRYLDDCTHDKKGQTLDLPDIE